MACPGSRKVLEQMGDRGKEIEKDYQVEGSTAHAGLAHCIQGNVEAWEIVGQKFDGHEFTVAMRDAVAEFLDMVSEWLHTGEEVWSEVRLHGSWHPAAMGTVDLGILLDRETLAVADFKYGAGVQVPVKDNPQFLYYAAMLLELPQCANVKEVRILVVQPRSFNQQSGEPWIVSADYVREWVKNTLLPAMISEDEALKVGDHCRFCPARTVCPVHVSLFETCLRARVDDMVALSDLALESDFELIPVIKMRLKALEDEMMRRALNGSVFQKNKLVAKTADRVWKPEALATLTALLGEKNIMSEPHLLSPAVIEKLSPAAKKEVAKLAYTPQTGYTLAAMSSKKPAVKVQPASVTFAAVAAVETTEEEW
jgi:hypothetical protein